MLEAKDLEKSYPLDNEKKLLVFSDVSLELRRAESVAIMGPSGCGKSTLISLLAGLDKADKGQVLINGRCLENLNSDQLADFRRAHIGMVFQQFHLLPHLTALENVRLPLDFDGHERAGELASAALKKVGLEHRSSHFPHKMSRGECQRTAIARAFVRQPSLVIADEPTGSLDQRRAREVISLLSQMVKDSEIALVLVTHDPQIAGYCDHRYSLTESGLILHKEN